MGDQGPADLALKFILMSAYCRREQLFQALLTQIIQVVEIWNNVFMEFNRKADGSGETTSTTRRYRNGFERLCMAMQMLPLTMIPMFLHPY
jgi:alanyl-tRNA synthetase